MSSRVVSQWRYVGALGVCAVLGWIAFSITPRVPVLALVDLGFAQLGHLAGAAVATPFGDPDVLVAVAGPLTQVAVPLALALRFLSDRWDRPAGALCLAWAATSLTAVGADVADAAAGADAGSGPHDWSVLLGPGGLVAVDRAGDLTGLLDGAAGIALAAALLVCAWPLVRDALGTSEGPVEPPRRWASSRRV